MLDKNLTNKLNIILGKRFKKNLLTLEKLKTIEKTYNIIFPKEYKDFLLIYGDRFVKDNYLYIPIKKSPVTGLDGYDMADYFIGNDIEENIKWKYDIFKNNIFPIAEAPGGNLICMGSNNEYVGKIYFWWHENERDDDPDNIRATLFLIANSFRDFILSFEYHIW